MLLISSKRVLLFSCFSGRLIYNPFLYCSLWYSLSIFLTAFVLNSLTKLHGGSPLINVNPCFPTFKLTVPNYQEGFMTINSFLSFHDNINTVIVFPMRTPLEHSFSEIKTKPFYLNFFHYAYVLNFVKLTSTLGGWLNRLHNTLDVKFQLSLYF